MVLAEDALLPDALVLAEDGLVALGAVAPEVPDAGVLVLGAPAPVEPVVAFMPALPPASGACANAAQATKLNVTPRRVLRIGACMLVSTRKKRPRTAGGSQTRHSHRTGSVRRCWCRGIAPRADAGWSAEAHASSAYGVACQHRARGAQ